MHLFFYSSSMQPLFSVGSASHGGSSFFSVGSAFDRYSRLKPTLSTPQGLKDAHTLTPSDLRRWRTARSDLNPSGDLLERRVD